MHITIDTSEALSPTDKAALRALIGEAVTTVTNVFPSQSERIAAGPATVPSNEQAKAREDGVGRRVQAAKAEADRLAAVGEDEDAETEPEEAEVDTSTDEPTLRDEVTALAEALVEAGKRAGVAKVLTSLGVRRVHRIADDKLEEAKVKLTALGSSAVRNRNSGPALPPEEDDADEADPLDDVVADDDDDDDSPEMTPEDAYKLARTMLDDGKRAEVVAALKKVGARKVTELTPEQVPGFVKALEG